MLVLTRKKNQSIMIDDNIEIIVVDVKSDQVKIGIKAPKKVSVHRKEVYEEIQMENKKAATQNHFDLDELNKIFKK